MIGVVQWGNDTTSDYDINPSSSKSLIFLFLFLKIALLYYLFCMEIGELVLFGYILKH